MTEETDQLKVPRRDSASVDEISKGVHLGCGAHGLAFIVILLLSLVSERFFLLFLWLGVFQFIYVVPCIRVMRSLKLGRNVEKGFLWPTGIIFLLSTAAIVSYYFFWK